ncbi:hypothetical protein EUX98_g9050, partial [Antrodiella citrinella]
FGNGSCAQIDPQQDFGNILFAGPYTPTHHPGSPPQTIEFYQNFTLTVPANFAVGSALVNVAHLSLVGAGGTPTLDFSDVTVNVAAAN